MGDHDYRHIYRCVFSEWFIGRYTDQSLYWLIREHPYDTHALPLIYCGDEWYAKYWIDNGT